ncbi:MAG TPA: sulfurtransferase [Pyrinomonadaceae bacterium]|nr:sulfurtransferase [Pyrinomonadaceae bacterium]
MNKKIIVIYLLFILSGVFYTTKAQTKNAPMTVSVEWLSQHLNDSNLILLHIGDKAEFDKGHIAGAQYISLRDISISRDNGKINTELPPDEDLKKAFEKFGVINNSRIILYFGNDWVSPTTRVFFTLDYLGLSEQTSILDGGMKAWTKAGKSITAEVKTPAAGSLKINPKKDAVAYADWLKTQLNNPKIAVVDARNTVFYDGTTVGNRPRGGHIQGAKTIPFDSLVNDDETFKTEIELRKIFTDAGVKKDETVVSYCHVGQQATVVYFLAKSLGYNVKVYDGSFEEWSERADLPVDDPKKETRTATIQFVQPEWVAARVNDQNLRIIDARNNVYDYFMGHIPNAVHLPDAALRAPRAGYPTQYLDTFVTSRLLANAGVKKDDRVVIYSDGTSVLGATMLAYLLERVGHKQILIMDGGWEAYKDKNPVAKEYPKYESGGYDIWDNRTVSVNLEEVKTAVTNAKVKFVDARPAENYTGEANVWVRNGHIPGAINVTWKTLMDEKNPHKLKPFAEIQKIYADAGITKDDDIVVYCGTSREASLEYVILKHLLGFPKVRLYEGSWAEYATYSDLKIETGSGKTANK